MEFKIVTLNCWGLPVVSKYRRQRMQAIAKFLATSQYDVVCLQEVWLNSDYELIKHKVSGVLPFSHYFYSGVTGSGVCILSRHPIEGAFFHQWAVNGYVHKIHHGDWFGGKGVGLCKLRVNNLIVNVYSAHLHAEYDRVSDEYLAHRVLQAFDTAQFIQMTSEGADLVVLAGDLNTEPGDLAHNLILTVPGLVDAFTEAGENVQSLAATNETPYNSFTAANTGKGNCQGIRIDYIMYHSGTKVQVELKNYSLPLPHRIPALSYSYTDHEAVAATLIINKGEAAVVRDEDLQLQKDTLEKSLEVCNDALKHLKKNKYFYWFYTIVLFILLITVLVTKPPYGFAIVVQFLKITITILMVYTFIMATVWNKMERHAFIAAELAMDIVLKKVKKQEPRVA